MHGTSRPPQHVGVDLSCLTLSTNNTSMLALLAVRPECQKISVPAPEGEMVAGCFTPLLEHELRPQFLPTDSTAAWVPGKERLHRIFNVRSKSGCRSLYMGSLRTDLHVCRIYAQRLFDRWAGSVADMLVT
jgi:hypothetical protein